MCAQTTPSDTAPAEMPSHLGALPSQHGSCPPQYCGREYMGESFPGAVQGKRRHEMMFLTNGVPHHPHMPG